MKALYDLREMLSEELEEIAGKKEMNAGDLETVHKLTDTIKNIDKICIMDEDGGYSQAGDWEARGRFGDNSYNEGGSSYRNQRRDSLGRYSRDGGYSQRRGRGGYSRAGGIDGMMEHLDAMMDEASSEKERDAIRRFKKQLENL